MLARKSLTSPLTSRISALTSRNPSSMCPLRSSRRSSVHDSLAMTAMVATVDRKPHANCAQFVNFACLAWDQTVNRTFDRGHVEAVLVVFAEGRGAFDGGAEDAVAACPLQVRHEAAQLPLTEVGVDVAAPQAPQAGVADDVAADDRAAAVAAVAVGEDRFDGAAGIRGAAVFVAVFGEALEGVPAEVRPPGRPNRRVVDLLELVLADVADRDPRLLGRGRV